MGLALPRAAMNEQRRKARLRFARHRLRRRPSQAVGVTYDKIVEPVARLEVGRDNHFLDNAGVGFRQGRDFQHARSGSVRCAAHPHLAHTDPGAAPRDAQAVAKLTRHEIRAEVSGDQQVERLRFGAIVAKPRRL